MSQNFTEKELLEYCKANSGKLIIVIKGNVYDVTKFAHEHPGGEDALKEFQVIDKIVDANDAFEDVGHSADAREIRNSYLIGKLV